MVKGLSKFGCASTGAVTQRLCSSLLQRVDLLGRQGPLAPSLMLQEWSQWLCDLRVVLDESPPIPGCSEEAPERLEAFDVIHFYLGDRFEGLRVGSYAVSAHTISDVFHLTTGQLDFLGGNRDAVLS